MISQYEVIQSHISKFKDTLYTSCPAIVTEVHLSGESIESVSVRPTIARVYTDGDIRTKPIINNVPVVFPSAGGGILSFPIEVGDTVLIIFCKEDIENFINGTSEIPRTLRRFSYNDAIAIPSLYPTSKNLQPSKDDTVLKYNGNSITLKKDGGIEVTADKGAIDTLAKEGNISTTANEGVISIAALNNKITINTKDTISITNSSEELVSLLSELIGVLESTTVNTIYGTSILNSKPALAALKSRLDTFKE